MNYKALSVFVAMFLSAGLYSNSSRTASMVCLGFIGALLFIDITDHFLRKNNDTKRNI